MIYIPTSSSTLVDTLTPLLRAHLRVTVFVTVLMEIIVESFMVGTVLGCNVRVEGGRVSVMILGGRMRVVGERVREGRGRRCIFGRGWRRGELYSNCRFVEKGIQEEL